ncbi:MAG: hypothetical protein ACHQXA_08080 [Gemmatimonadales bacterium]
MKRWHLLLVAVAAAACSTEPGNHYGSGGSTGTIQAGDVNSGVKQGVSHFMLKTGGMSTPLPVGSVGSFRNLNPGDYVVTLDSLANCAVTNSNPQTVHVDPGYVTYLTFNTACS